MLTLSSEISLLVEVPMNAKVLSRCGCLHFSEFSRYEAAFEYLIKGNNIVLVPYSINSPQFILACMVLLAWTLLQ